MKRPTAKKTLLLRLVEQIMRGPHYEPEQSTRDRSAREMRLGPHHIRHRFPIPGGISGADMMRKHLTGNNALLERLRSRRGLK